MTGLPPGTRRYYFDPDAVVTVPARGLVTVRLVVQVTRSVSVGDYPLTITGDDGSITHDYNVMLEVRRPPRFGRLVVKTGIGVPEEFVLTQNYPNPFNPETAIDFGIPDDGHVRISVYNLLGQEVGMLMDAELEAGYYNVPWDASDQPTGVYFYRIVAGGFSAMRKMILMK